MPDNDDGERLRLSKCMIESIEKISSFHKSCDPNSISQPLTFSRELVSTSLKIIALGLPTIVSIASGNPDFPGSFIISIL